MRQPLSDEQDASTEGPLSLSTVGRHASFLTAPMWQKCTSKAIARDGGSILHSSERVKTVTYHN